jgi:3-hydroxybutyryl-CoA dehydratase
MHYDMFVIGYTGAYTKPVTLEDNQGFAELSGDHNPIHFDDEVARACSFRARISNGFVTESRVAAALVETFGSEKTIVVALQKNTKFLRPVYMGDVITATVEVVGRQEAMSILQIAGECRNQDGAIVAKTSMVVKIYSRSV